MFVAKHTLTSDACWFNGMHYLYAIQADGKYFKTGKAIPRPEVNLPPSNSRQTHSLPIIDYFVLVVASQVVCDYSGFIIAKNGS